MYLKTLNYFFYILIHLEKLRFFFFNLFNINQKSSLV